MTLNDAMATFGYRHVADVNAAQLKADYRKLAVKHHPDRGGDAASFAKVSMAHERLILLIADMAFDTMYSEEPKQQKAEEPKSDPSGSKGKPGRCGKHTKSGPCIRPEGHPHGCMSQSVYDTKRANAKARKAAQNA
ncbi:MAG TPA: hypothetical protein VGG75_06260 [Trebonia sp.]